MYQSRTNFIGRSWLPGERSKYNHCKLYQPGEKPGTDTHRAYRALPGTIEDIRERSGMNQARCRRALRQLMDKGRVVRDGDRYGRK